MRGFADKFNLTFRDTNLPTSLRVLTLSFLSSHIPSVRCVCGRLCLTQYGEDQWWESSVWEYNCLSLCVWSAIPSRRCCSTHFDLISVAWLIQVAQLMVLSLPWASSMRAHACTQPNKYAQSQMH